ncbi:uncharacterized protein LOC135149294 isoform X2 [Daucus carota subsp. sativus]|uniref:uncharacterized protein LOC135149294 isoform X2 n=1 Tax=Daucus carota subsp. sativus TaxID=79200 RepID=UPI0030832523
MDNGRKRNPLGSVSPSSARIGQRRPYSQNDQPHTRENLDPNIISVPRQAPDISRNGSVTWARPLPTGLPSLDRP